MEATKKVASFSDFIYSVPLFEKRTMIYQVKHAGPIRLEIDKVQSYCKECDAAQYFYEVNHESEVWSPGVVSPVKIVLKCRNCQSYTKSFLVKINDLSNASSMAITLEVEKVAEYPADYKAASKQELSLLGGERQEFFKGLRCEREGLGAAAFLYYRRVVEKRRNKIFDQIIKVLNDSPNVHNQLIQELESAKSEGQFVKSIDKIKTAFPESLLISGQNPLKLLYSALSEGVHELTDQECLECAEDVRVVLLTMSERIDILLSESKHIDGAIKRLAQRASSK